MLKNTKRPIKIGLFVFKNKRGHLCPLLPILTTKSNI